MATAKKKTLQIVEPRYNPFHRSRWVEYVEDGADDGEIAFRIRLRTNLTFAELEDLTWDPKAQDRELWPMFAPYVLDWNISGFDEEGNDVEIPSPAVDGPEQFRHVPPELFLRIVQDVKMRSTLPLVRKSPSPSGTTPEAASDIA